MAFRYSNSAVHDAGKYANALQLILAIAILGLSASLVAEKFCDSDYCILTLSTLWAGATGFRTTHYCIFLGLYGIAIATFGTICLFMDRIPMMVPLVGDSIGALFFLAGGIAWTVNLARLEESCGDMKNRWSGYPFADSLVSTCRRCEADHGLVWALFACTAILAICDFFRRRDQGQSSK